MNVYSAFALGFLSGPLIVLALHWWTGNTVAQMREEAKRMEADAMEMAKASEDIHKDIDRRMADLMRAKQSLEDRWGGSVVASELAKVRRHDA